MRTGRPKKPLEIVDDARGKLTMLARRPKSAQAMAMRARIVLSCGQGMSNAEVARKLQITGATVGKWRERFREFGLDGLLDEPRVGAPRKITDRQIEDVVTRTLESMPVNSTHWSTRLMAEETGLSQNAIDRADLACLRIATASCGELQVLQRSPICREGARYRGAIPESAGSCDRALRG